MDILQYVKDTWGLSDTQAQRYWMAAVNYLRPKEPEKYREAIISKNIDLLETIIRRALESNNLKEANNAIKTLNSMLGVGGKSVEIADKDAAGEDRKIVISFND